MKTHKYSLLFFGILFLFLFGAHAQETEDLNQKKFQFSLAPPVSSNGPQNAQTINNISFNLLVGHAYGVKSFELGGLYNILGGDVKGAQISGFGNTVGGNVRGFQMAGFINTNKGSIRGAQVAGFINHTSDKVQGFQMSGFININKKYVQGTQLAGFINLASDSTKGAQVAGFSNISQNTNGIQLAGFNNHNKETDGAQVAGFINTTGRLDGFQMAGFINVAKEVKGTQFGIINIADSIESGAQFGLVNISKKNGFISPGFESDDTIPYRLIFRSGQDKFYALLSAGIKVDEYWSYGAGFGSRLYISKKQTTFINPELRFHNINKGKLKANKNNHLVKLNLNLGYQAFKHMYITTGPSINFYMSNQLDQNGQPAINLVNNPSVDKRSGRNSYQVWLGYSIGIGFN